MIEGSGECNNSCAGTLGRLDLYMPPNCDDDSPKPVVIFVTGGAWIIGLVASLCCWDSFLSSNLHAISLWVEITPKGLKLMLRLINRYKGWAALLGQQLAEHHIIVTCLDYRCMSLDVHKRTPCLQQIWLHHFPYESVFSFLVMYGTFLLKDPWTQYNVLCWQCRNFPQGSVSDMVADISTGIGYVCQNITNLGGDPNRWGHKRIPFSQVWLGLHFLKRCSRLHRIESKW
jgi:hypothetical protein